MNDKNPVSIHVSRAEVEACDTSRASTILASFVPALLDVHRNRIQIEVFGYDQDPRALYDVEEVRSYFKRLYDENPGLFYWIDVDSCMFMFFGLMLYPPHRVPGGVGLTPSDMKDFLLKGYYGLNGFCEKTGARPDKTNVAILAVLAKFRGG